MNLDGCVAVVTGGATGVGRATALRLAQKGCSVVVNYQKSADEAFATVAAAKEIGVRALAFQADVSSEAASLALMEAAVENFGRIDVLVNSAGTTTFVSHGNLDGISEDEWDRIFAVNVRGAFYAARAARAAMDQRDVAHIVNVSSIAGIAGIGSSIPYCASKAALNNLTVTLARALAPRIRVNAVAPGFITGRWLEQGLGPAYGAIKSHMENKAKLGKVCEADDVAQAIMSFVTGADLITGQVLVIDGGLTLAG